MDSEDTTQRLPKALVDWEKRLAELEAEWSAALFTQVGFGGFLSWYLDKARRERAIEFSEYPRSPLRWLAGQWLYEVQQGFRVRLFRWLEREREREG